MARTESKAIEIRNHQAVVGDQKGCKAAELQMAAVKAMEHQHEGASSLAYDWVVVSHGSVQVFPAHMGCELTGLRIDQCGGRVLELLPIAQLPLLLACGVGAATPLWVLTSASRSSVSLTGKGR